MSATVTDLKTRKKITADAVTPPAEKTADQKAIEKRNYALLDALQRYGDLITASEVLKHYYGPTSDEQHAPVRVALKAAVYDLQELGAVNVSDDNLANALSFLEQAASAGRMRDYGDMQTEQFTDLLDEAAQARRSAAAARAFPTENHEHVPATAEERAVWSAEVAHYSMLDERLMDVVAYGHDMAIYCLMHNEADDKAHDERIAKLNEAEKGVLLESLGARAPTEHERVALLERLETVYAAQRANTLETVGAEFKHVRDWPYLATLTFPMPSTTGDKLRGVVAIGDRGSRIVAVID